jgi:hypothetical protein
MSVYYHRSNLPYIDYLQAKSFEDSLKGEIATQSRKIIASNAELQRQHIQIEKDVHRAVKSGLEHVSMDMQLMTGEIQQLTSQFNWGISQILMEMGNLNASLEELKRIAKTPSQTWSYEQFEIARDAFRQKIYDDALISVERAIAGFGDHTGYRLDYRFHFLRGLIKMGNFENVDPSVVNIGEAEKAFLESAKYARTDFKKESGRALLAAGWAAYCQGKADEAETYTRQAATIITECPESHYQLAKIMMHKNLPQNAVHPLKTAIRLDRKYTIKACMDHDFIQHKDYVDQLLDELRREARSEFEIQFTAADRMLKDLIEMHTNKLPFVRTPINPEMKKQIRHIKDSVKEDTYFGFLDGIQQCGKLMTQIAEARNQFVKESLATAKMELAAVCSKKQQVENGGIKKQYLYLLMVLIGLLAIFGFNSCSNRMELHKMYRAGYQTRFQNAVAVRKELQRKGQDPNRVTEQQITDACRALGIDVKQVGRAYESKPGNGFGTGLGLFLLWTAGGGLIVLMLIIIIGKIDLRKEAFKLEKKRIKLANIVSDIERL